MIIPMMISNVIGSSAAPLGKALYPNTCCRYRLRKNHIGIQAAPSRNCAPLAAAKVGARKIDSRTSGWLRRAWMATNAASSATDPPSTAQVCALAQPTSGARTIP